MDPSGSINYSGPRTVRSAGSLTASYVAGNIIGPGAAIDFSPHQYNQMALLLQFTLGSLTSAEVKVEYSPDNSTFFQETATSTSGGDVTGSLANFTVSATGNYRFLVPIMDKFIKISAKGTGTLTAANSAAIDVTFGTT